MARRNLEQLLKSQANYWARQLTLSAKAKAPKHIAPYISTSTKVTADTANLTLQIKKVDMRNAEGAVSNYGTMDALAQEYGHPGAVIKPRIKKYLAFQWDVHPENARYDKEGRILLQSVTKTPQPAFNSGAGYIRPALDEWKAEFYASSSKFKNAIGADIMESLNKIGANLRSSK